MTVRVFVAAILAALGLGLYAVATLVWDRRNSLRQWLSRRRNSPEPVGPGAVAGVIAALAVVGTALLLASCMGLIAF